MTAPYLPMEGFGMQGLRLPKWLVNPETDDEYAMRFPGTFGDPMGVPNGSVMGPDGLMVPPSPQVPSPAMVSPANPNWAARLFGGADPLAGGTLQAPQANSLGRDALRQMGISLLQNSGPNPYRRGLGELLGTALGAGQQAYQQGTLGALARLREAEDRKLRERALQVQEHYANAPAYTPPARQYDTRPIWEREGYASAEERIADMREQARIRRDSRTPSVPRAPTRTRPAAPVKEKLTQAEYDAFIRDGDTYDGLSGEFDLSGIRR